MAESQTHVKILGSERIPPAKAVRGERVALDEPVQVSVLVRRRESPAPNAAESSRQSGTHFSRQEFRDRYGADPAELETVANVLEGYGLRVMESNVARRTVVMVGPASAATAAFQVELARYTVGELTYRGREGPVYIPAVIAALVEGVFGLDNRPQVRPYVRRAKNISGRSPAPHDAQGLNAIDVAAAYQFPPNTSGAGQTVGIVEFGGGFLNSDLATFFGSLNLAVPKVVTVSVDGGANNPGVDGHADQEVGLDMQVVGACAPNATIVMYFGSGTEAGFVDAVTTMVNDSINNPTVLSISWGNNEEAWTAMSLTAIESAFIDAAMMGVTVCVASGDDGASDLVSGDGLAHVDFPASAPHALACGGTHLEVGRNAAAESVWNDGDGASGGGISSVFPVPAYQVGLSLPSAVNAGAGLGRGVPDVAGDAAPATGINVFVDHKNMNLGGTSAVAPLWAALIARLNEGLGGQLGFVHPQLYALRGNGVFNDITVGNNDVGSDNGGYQAQVGWDCCTGLGTPRGMALMSNLSPSTLSQFFAPDQITCGYSDDSAMIFINKPYAADVHIDLRSDEPQVLGVAAFVVIAAGSTSARVRLTARPIRGPFLPKFVNVHATFAGKTLTIAAEVVPPRVMSLTLSPSTVTSGQSSKAKVTLDRASRDGNVELEVFCGAPGFATVPGKLSIKPGKLSATFTVTTPAIAVPFATAEASILAIYRASSHDPGTSATANLTVQSSVVAGILQSVTLAPSTVSGGGFCRGTVTLVQGVPTSTLVGLAALEPLAVGGTQFPTQGNASTIASVPTSVTLNPGEISKEFNVTTQNVVAGTTRKALIMAGAVVIRTATLTITH